MTVTEGGTQYSFGQDVGPDGSGTVVWSAPSGDDGYSVFARQLDAADGAGPRLILSTPDPGTAFASAYAPAVRYDAAGAATVVWMETTYGSDSCFNEEGDPGGGECEVDEYVLARQVSGGGSLSPVRQLQHRHAVYPDEGSFGGSSPAYVTYGQPALAGGPGNTLTVVWSEGAFGSGCAAYGYYSSYADAECEAQTDIKWARLGADAVPLGAPQSAYSNETSGYGSGQPLLSLRVGAAADGTATVLFGARKTAAEEGCWGGESAVGFLRIGPGGTATAPSELDSGCGAVQPDLALDPGGTATAVWSWEGTYSDDEALLARIDPGGGAEQPHTLLDSAGGAHVSGLDVARGAAGSALAVWSEEGRISSRRIPSSGPLAPTVTVATPAPGRDFRSPRLAVGPDDSAAVVWEAGSGGFARAYSLRAVDLAPDGTPGQARTLLAANRWNHGVRISPGAAGTFLASWRVSVPQHNRVQAAWFSAGQGQSNDDFEAATTLDPELPDFTAGSTAGATRQPEEPNHAGAGGNASVWYSWTPSASGPVTLATCADEGFDPALAVYTGATLTALTEVAAASDGAPDPCVEGDSGVRFDAVAGTTYLIAVDGEGASAGSFALELVSRQSAPANDDFAAAKEVLGSLPRQLFAKNVDGSREPGEPEHGGADGGASVWYSWTASRSAPAWISACGSDSLQPLLGVYTGATLAGLSAVGTQSGPAPDCSTAGASVRFAAVAGTTYRVAVDGRDGREGRFSLRFAQRPPNDDFEGAETISPFLPGFASGSTIAATKQAEEPAHAGETGGASVWYSWTPSSSGTAFLSACLSAGKETAALLAVYTGADVGHLTEVASDAGGGGTKGCFSGYSKVSFGFQANTTYRIAVDGKGGAEASFSLNLEQLPANDSAAGAQVIGPAAPIFISSSNRHASKEPGEPPHAGDPGGASVWYSWMPSESGEAILSACLFAGKDESALLAVYTGADVGHLTEVASDAGGGSTSGCFSRFSEVGFSFEAGTRYLIALDGPGGAEASFSLNLESRPANDDFENAREVLSSLPQTVSGSSRHATKQTGEPPHAGETGGASVWYSWTPSSSGIAVVSACAPSGQPLLAAYAGSAVGALAGVAGAAGDESGSSCFGSRAKVEFDAVAGTHYHLAIDDAAGVGLWSFSLEVNLELAPANDDFSAAQAIPSGSQWFSGSNRHATKQPEEPNHAGEDGGASVWFSWTPAEGGAYAIATCAFGSFDPLLAVYTGSTLGGLDPVASDDAGGNCSAGDAEVRFTATAGTTYRIAVDGKSAGGGFFELRFGTPPGNDDLAAATEISGEPPLVTGGSNWLATKQLGEPPHAGDAGGTSVWYSWTPSESSRVELTVCANGALDPLLAVYTGSSPAALAPVASEDAGADPECFGHSTRLKLDAQAGTAYKIAVDGRGGSYGDFSLSLRSRPANDDFADAEALGAALPQSAFGDNRIASREPTEPEHAGEEGGASVWYSWTPASGGTVVLSTCAFGSLDPLLAVYTGSSLGTLEEVASNADAEDPECSDGDAKVRFDAQPGSTYLIAVDGEGESGGQFQLRLRAAGPVNDDFGDAIDVAQAPGSEDGTTAGASSQAGEPGSPHQSVWYRMQVDHNGTVRLHTCGEAGAPMDLDVFTGSSLASLSPVAVKPAATAAACDGAPGVGLFGDTPALGFEAAAGTVYWISVDRYQQVSPVFELRPPGPFTLVVDPPANDLRAAAERIPAAGASLARTNVGATHEPDEDEHAGEPGGGSIWFRWFARADGPVGIDTCGSAVDTLMSVFGSAGSAGGSGGGSGEEYSDELPAPEGGGSAGEQYSDDPPAPPAAGGLLASSDDSELCGPGSAQSGVVLQAHEGLQYLIAVDGKEGDTGPIQLSLDFDVPDTTPPATHAFLPTAINSHSLSFSVIRDEPESSLQCAVDGDAFAQCAAAEPSDFVTIQIPGLAEGAHTVAVREVDLAGNADPTPTEGQVLVDTIAPQTSFAGGPEGLTRELGPFQLEADEPALYFECALDGGPAAHCSSPYFASDDLADGTHVLKVTAADLVGNRDPSPATRTFELDRTAPTATIESGPEGVLGAGVADFEFSADEPATFGCQLDGQGLGACESPFELTGIADGIHLLFVRPTDLAGNVGGSAEWEFEVETKPPNTTIVGGPPTFSPQDSASIPFVSSESPSTFECAVDGGGFAACESPLELEGLAEGEHELRVRAIDAGGEPDPTPAALSWTVDTVPPQTAIISAPPGPVHQPALQFEFASNEALGKFQCALDGGAFRSCAGLTHDRRVGTHEFAVRAFDRAGNVDPTPATHEFEVVNEDPVPTLELDRATGPAPLALNASIGAEDGDGDALTYTVQWGDGTQSNGNLPQEALAHTYDEPGIYLVSLAVSDGFGSPRTVTELVNAGPAEALRADAGDDRVVVTGQPVSFDGSGSRPATSIDSYGWSFGDGSQASGKGVTHAFSSPGTYDVTLTVSGAGAPDSDTATVQVVPPPPTPVEVLVHDGADPVAGAIVMVNLPNGTRVQGTSGADGVAHLPPLPDGSYKALAFHPGYQPASGDVEVAEGEGGGDVELDPGDVAELHVGWNRLTLDEIEDLGIDPQDPANQHVFEFVAHIGGGTISGYLGRGGFFGGSCEQQGSTAACGVGGFKVSLRSYWPEGSDGPLVTTFAIPARATFLKEFYRVEVGIHNMASSEFSLSDGHAQITVPGGMSLAPTAEPQSETLSVPDIPGGQERTLSWVLRGDVEGEYDVSVDYVANLQPFGAPLQLHGETERPIKVWGGSALRLEVDADGEARDRYPYAASVKLKNVADVPVYNVSVDLPEEGRVGYVEQPRQGHLFSVRELAPGATFTAGPFILVPDSSEVDLDQSFVRKVAGDVDLGGTVVTHVRAPSFSENPRLEATNLGEQIRLDWEPVPGADGYEVYQVPDRETPFGEEPIDYDKDGETAALVPAPLEGEEAYYAVSTIVNGHRTMVHPLVKAPPPPPPGEGDEDALGAPKGECGLTHVTLGPAEILASCFEKKGSNLYEATSRVRVNGIDLFPKDARIIVDAQQQRITVSNARLQVGNIVLYQGRVNWSPRATIRLGLPSGTTIRGIPVSGDLAIHLEPTRADLEASAKLPSTLGGVSGKLKLGATNEDGPKLDRFELEASGLSLAGRLGIDGVLLKYKRTAAGDRWEGGATLAIPRPQSPLLVHGRLAILNGKFASAAAEVDGINQYIAYGVFLQRLRASVAVNPLSLSGGIGLSAGPQVLGHEAISVDGDGTVTFGDPHVYEVRGKVRVVEAEIASGYLKYQTSGLVEFGGKLGIDKSGFKATVSADGWVDGTRAFNAHGSGSFSAPGVSFGAEGVVSSVGIAACRHGFGPDVGAGYHWGGDVKVFGSSCDVGEFEAVRSRAVGGGALRFQVAPDEPVEVLAFSGAAAPPRVVLREPNGTEIVTPADGRGLDEPRLMLLQSEQDDTTYMAVFSPPGGSWTVDTAPGSPPITGIRRAGALPDPQAEATVERVGQEAVLSWHVRPIPGQRVQFVERTAHGAQVIATTNSEIGSATFTPLVDDDASRQIVAVVEQYGLPRETGPVESYRAPEAVTAPSGAAGAVGAQSAVGPQVKTPRRPAAPARVRVRRRPGRAIVSWSAVRGASRYLLRGRLSSGRWVRATPVGRRFVIRGVSASDGVAVSVRALASDGRRGVSRAARLRAVR